MQQLERFASDAPLVDMLAAYERDGGIIVEDMVERSVIDRIRAAADAYAKNVEPGSANQGLGEDGKSFVGARTVRFSSLGCLTPAYFDLLDNATFAAVADALLLPNCGSYWVNTGQVMYINPGEPAQMQHRDANNWWSYVKGTWPE